MARVFYLPGTGGESAVTDEATGAVFVLDEFGRAVAEVDDKDGDAFRGRSDCWIEGDPRPPAPEVSPGDEEAGVMPGIEPVEELPKPAKA